MAGREKKPLISVVVPVYNVEKYLPKCLDSLLAQTWQELEIIVVDDGSPDNSWDIMQDYGRPGMQVWRQHGASGSVFWTPTITWPRRCTSGSTVPR